MHYLWMDCETFGMNPKVNPLATVYMAVYDEKDKFIEDLDLKVKPDNMDGLYADPETEKIHGINFEKHVADPNTITYSQALPVIVAFFEKHKIPRAKKSLKPAGQNVVFDIDYLRNTIFTRELWDQHVHYRYIDTLVILSYLQDVELVPGDLGNLASLIEYFDLKTGEFHDAKADTKMAVQVYISMKNLILRTKNSTLSSPSANLLKIIED